VVGLLGAVCSGKSTVARLLAEMGFRRIDADEIGHRVLERKDVGERLREAFGEEIFCADGTVDRARLARSVFGSKASLSKLNAIVHPPILEVIERAITRLKQEGEAAGVVLDAPLLMETGLHHRCDVLVFVDAPEEVRLERARRHRGWSPEELRSREAAQIPPERKRQQADFVIQNSGTEQDLREAVMGLVDRIRTKPSAVPGMPGEHR